MAAPATKADVYAEVTDRIIEALEAGTVPWRKPWNAGLAGGPANIRTGRTYRGINVFLLGLQGYSDPRWGTFKAMQESGGSVRKGEHGTRIILRKPVKREDDGNGTADPSYLLLRTYTVFNAEQCDGLPELETHDVPDIERIARADALIEEYVNFPGPALLHGGDRAAYSPDRDMVYMPHPEAFESPEAYYSTTFHELTHSTGHESRLKRLEPATFGSDPYAKEELVAEMGAAMLAGLTGIGTVQDEASAAYIASWLGKLKDDRKLVIQAAAQAQKAADLIVGETFAVAAEDETPALAVAA